MSPHSTVAGEQVTPPDFAPKHRTIAFIDVIAPLALAVSTLVAVTVVSIGIARAEAFGARSDGSSATLAIALFVGLLLTSMGGLTAIMADDRTTPRD
jgi:hypothetical protein